MKNALLLLAVLFASLSSFAQQQKEKMTREEKDEKIQARATRVNNKNDYAIFHRQILSLKEYLDERKKIPALQKSTRASVKVVAVVDSLEDDENVKVLTGAIRQDIGDNSINVYELFFDRKEKKITIIKHTQEAIEAEKDAAADKEERTNTTTTKTKEKTVEPKKKKSDDDDDDADDEKPVKGKKPKDTDED